MGGQAKATVDPNTYHEKLDYEGEIDEQGNACGFGVATKGKEKYEGTFHNNALHGISCFTCGYPDWSFYGECRQGHSHAKWSNYSGTSSIQNQLWQGWS